MEAAILNTWQEFNYRGPRGADIELLKELEGALARFRGPPWRRRRHVQTGQLDGNFRATMYTYGCKHMRSHPYKKSATLEISSSLLSLRAKCRIVVLATVVQIGERREATFHSISECLSDILIFNILIFNI